jgi:hypothetical protein
MAAELSELEQEFLDGARYDEMDSVRGVPAIDRLKERPT